jgi:hypothetical protein
MMDFISLKTIPHHSWDVSRSFVMIEKQWLSSFVSWSHELWPENGTNQAKFSTARTSPQAKKQSAS